MNKKKEALIIIAIVLIVLLAATALFFGVRGCLILRYRKTPVNLPDGFTITAHTGCMGTEENSFESIRLGVENGANTVEFDVSFLSDGTAVLSHDEPTGDEITLEEAFAYFSQFDGISANVDIKSTANLAEIETLAMKYGISDRIFLTGVKESYVDAVKKSCPNVEFYLNIDVDKSKADNGEYIATLIEKVRNCGAIGINCNYKNVKAELVKAFHDAGLSVSLWTVNSEFNMHKILNFAPDNITTKNPDVLSEITENRQKIQK